MTAHSDSPRTLPAVPVGPVDVLDASADEVVSAIVALCTEPDAGVRTAYALHVGGLNVLARGDDDSYAVGLRGADVVYTDGAAVLLLARAAGARRVERAPTTDIGLPVLRGLGDAFGRPARVALVGGPPGLAERAGAVMASNASVAVVFVADGYRRDDDVLAAELRRVKPDLLIVGMGVPREVEWVERLKPQLPATTVLTCGGWFGFLVGEEKRAPVILQRLHLEWLNRLLLAPGRLAPRYLRGVWSTLQLLPRQLGSRRDAA